MTSILYVRKTIKKSKKAARSASPVSSTATKVGIKKELDTWAKLEQIAEDPRKPIKTRKAALSKLDGIQRRWDSRLSKAGR